jgi:hypothetical protein
MLKATRSVMVRDLAIFLLKLTLDGLKDLVLLQLALGAALLDLLSGGGKRERLFYSVLRLSERFDLWLNLNGAMDRMESGQEINDDGLFGASDAGSDTLLGKLEELVRGGDVPEGRHSGRGAGGPRGGVPGSGAADGPVDGVPESGDAGEG